MIERKAIDLVRLAVEVREAQRRYFRTRTKEDLAASKALEASLDREAQTFLAIIDPPKPGAQGSIF